MNLCNLHFAPILLLFLKLSSTTGYGVPFVKHFQERCDWRGQSEICDQSRGLACSYLTEACDCWDVRKIFSTKVHRCVGKAGEECAYFETERMCTENAYCLEDRSLSPIPLCVCLKGYFRTDNGSCVKYSKFEESCEPFPPNRLACEPATGLKCYGYTCQCEADHIYDPTRDLCIARAGAKCSRTLNNCVENADCSEKTWALDHVTGTTKLSGYRCVCKPGLKITEDGHCSSQYGGVCNRTSDCFPGEDLTCLNGICQCQPLSQIYVKKHRRCFNLAGTKCQPQVGVGEGGDKNGNSSMKNASFRRNSRISLESSSSTPSSSSSTTPHSSPSTPTSPSSSPSLEDGDTPQFRNMGTEGAECIFNSECVTTAHGSSHCQCVAGSSETMIKTCLLNYDQSCQDHGLGREDDKMENEIIQSRAQIFVLEKEMKCNVFEGLICQSDSGKCLCADPSLVYDPDQRDGSGGGCVARVGKACGNLRLGMLDLSQEIKEMIFINCEKNSTCLELTGGGGMSKRVCVPFSNHNQRKQETGAGSGSGSSLSKLLFNNANVISATD